MILADDSETSTLLSAPVAWHHRNHLVPGRRHGRGEPDVLVVLRTHERSPSRLESGEGRLLSSWPRLCDPSVLSALSSDAYHGRHRQHDKDYD